MKIFITLFTALIIFFSSEYITAQVTGLSGWNIFIDPGHSKTENMGIYNYSEAQKVVRVGLNLRELLLETTDIDTVYLSRTNDQQEVTLTQRTDLANSLGAAWYHSIHSDAGGPTANSTLLLHGGWRTNGQTIEKTPNGGKEMSDIIVDVLTRGYRTNTRGNFADRYFYDKVDNHTRKYPYLHVNRETTMPSELSEAGFHTNPTQNQRNMNDKWKRLEAYIFYWSILQYHGIQRPPVGIVTGIISDIESALPINGAVVSVNGQVDTTDTYESLFNKYSSDPNQLRNGFYFFEGLPAGTYDVSVQVEDFVSHTGTVTIQDTFFTFKDVALVSTVPPKITSIVPAQGDSLYPGVDNIVITFSRPMDKASVESTLLITPSVQVSYTWSDGDRKLSIATTNFNFNDNYQLKISGTAFDKYNHPFDGNGDKIGGDDYLLTFQTKVQDIIAPAVADFYPPAGTVNLELKPIININFSEQINTSTLSGKVKLVRNSDQANISGILKHYVVKGQSVVNLFINTMLSINESYTLNIEPGIKDLFGNENTAQFTSTFTTGNVAYAIASSIDNYENGIGNWWQPQESSSTRGIITEQTSAASALNIYNALNSGARSLQLLYGFDPNASLILIREHYPPTTPSFNNSNILQVYVFGDGNGNNFRFAARDNTSIEVSPWYSIDWIGWKLVQWDMANDGTGSWIGNGVLDNPLRFDSFQLTYEPGKNNIGEIYFDDLSVVNRTVVGVESEPSTVVPSDYILEQNYPNPFNPSTRIKFGIPGSGKVNLEVYNLLGEKVLTLVDDYLEAGYHFITLDASGLSSGVYVYRLRASSPAGEFASSMKMLLMK